MSCAVWMALYASKNTGNCVILCGVDTPKMSFRAKIRWNGPYIHLFFVSEAMGKAAVNCYHCITRTVYANVFFVKNLHLF